MLKEKPIRQRYIDMYIVLAFLFFFLPSFIRIQANAFFPL